MTREAPRRRLALPTTQHEPTRAVEADRAQAPGLLLAGGLHAVGPAAVVRLQRTAGNARTGAALTPDRSPTAAAPVTAQREKKGQGEAPDSSSSGTGAGALAWEIFSPVATSGLRSLAPGAFKLTAIGGHHAEVIEIADKVADSAEKLHDYHTKVIDLKKEAAAERKFALASLGKVNAHFSSIPDAVAVDGQALIGEAAQVVNADMFTNMPDAVQRLQAYAIIVEETRRLRGPYAEMSRKLANCAIRARASFDALGVLQDTLLDVAKVAILPVYQAWAFGESQTVGRYRGDVATLLSTIEAKRKGYEDAIAASEAMEAYLSGNTGRKTLADSYRTPKSPACVARLKDAIPAVVSDPDNIYTHVLPYDECTFDHIMDGLDFLPIDETDGVFALAEGLLSAFPDRAGEIEMKQDRYAEGVKLVAELDQVRPALAAIDALLNPLVMQFIWKEYYHFWRDDPRSLLSNHNFTYLHQIRRMRSNVSLLPLAAYSFAHFASP